MYKYILIISFLWFSITSVAQNQEQRSDQAFDLYRIDSLILNSKVNEHKWQSFLKGEKLIAGVYLLAAGDVDRQQPHESDEIYYLLKGKAKFQVEDKIKTVSEGDVLFVRAGVAHRFIDIEKDLEILVIFDK